MLIRGIESVALGDNPRLYLRTEDADALQADLTAASAPVGDLYEKYAARALTEETVKRCAGLQLGAEQHRQDAERLLQDAEAVRNA